MYIGETYLYLIFSPKIYNFIISKIAMQAYPDIDVHICLDSFVSLSPRPIVHISMKKIIEKDSTLI